MGSGRDGRYRGLNVLGNNTLVLMKTPAEKCAERLHEKGYLPHIADIPIAAEIIDREYSLIIRANNIAMMSAVERLERFHRVYGGCHNEIQKLKEQLK